MTRIREAVAVLMSFLLVLMAIPIDTGAQASLPTAPPPNPQIVYVPTYNPTVIYGAPVVVPGYSSADVAAAAIISFGAGMAVAAMMNGGCCGWGWGYWGTS
jgi:hypothetical protein